MAYSYDPILVFISILVAVVGAYSCFDLVIKLGKHDRPTRKRMLIGASFAIGGSIWAMHFVAMLALNLPIIIQYDVLTTLVSGLVSVLMTALALLIVLSSKGNFRGIVVAGVVMGAGISSMHYVGMMATRGNCIITYTPAWVALSIIVGIVASTASLWCAMHLHGLLRRVLAAVIMGVSISGVHYVGMIGTTYVAIDNALVFSQPILNPFTLGLVTAITAFIILGWALLIMIPNTITGIDIEGRSKLETASETKDTTSSDQESDDPTPTEKNDHSPSTHTLPIRKNQRTYFIELNDLVSVSADGHYTSVFTSSGEVHFCNFSLTRIADQLEGHQQFLKVHRSHLINTTFIDSFERHHDKGIVWLCGGKHQIPVSRSHIPELQKILGL